MRALPPATLRLFDGYDPAMLHDPASREFVIGRLLEEGDAADLAWLGNQVDREALAGWVRRRGARQLSRRSRLFWRQVLELGPEPADESVRTREEIWPL